MRNLRIVSTHPQSEETRSFSISQRVKNIRLDNYPLKQDLMLLIMKLTILAMYIIEAWTSITWSNSLLVAFIVLTPEVFLNSKMFGAYENIILFVNFAIIQFTILFTGQKAVFSCVLFTIIAVRATKLLIKSIYVELVVVAIQICVLIFPTYWSLAAEIKDRKPEQVAFLIIVGAIEMILLNILMIYMEKADIPAPGNGSKKTNKKGLGTEKQRTFILSFSHELRNLINNMLGNIQVSMNEEPCSKIKEYLKNAKICGDMLIYSINNILDSGKIDSGNLEINIGPLNIYSALLDIWGVCSALMKKRDLNGYMYISKNLPHIIKSDPYRLAQVIFNLMSNAIKYTEFGQVRLLVEWISDYHSVSDKVFQPAPYDEEGLFEKKCKILSFSEDYFLAATETYKKNQFPYSKPAMQSEGILKITISDSGKGIDEAVLENCFTKVRSAFNPDCPRKLKTGLGLFVTKQIVEKMSGEIRGYSSRGKGSSLVVCLETESVVEDSTIVVRRSFVNSLSNEKKTALIIDDDKFFHNVMANYLNKLDFEIGDSAFNGEEAVTKYVDLCKLGKQPDLITLDLEMPILDGKEAARRIRKFESEMKIKPCIIMVSSANCDEAEINECLRENGNILAQEFLKKPVQLSELKRVVNKFFS